MDRFRMGNLGLETWEWKHGNGNIEHRTQDMYGHTVISYGYKMPHRLDQVLPSHAVCTSIMVSTEYTVAKDTKWNVLWSPIYSNMRSSIDTSQGDISCECIGLSPSLHSQMAHLLQLPHPPLHRSHSYLPERREGGGRWREGGGVE